MLNLSSIHHAVAGRGEVVRLAMAYLNVPLVEEVVEYEAMKQDLARYPCSQCPRFVDDDVDMVQSNAIMRHIGRKYSLYGTTLAQQAAVDMIVDTVEALKQKHWSLIYVEKLNDVAKDEYWRMHFDPKTVSERNGGAHMMYIDQLVRRYGASSFAAGDSFTIADIVVFDMFGTWKRIYGDALVTMYPGLQAHGNMVAGLPGISEYLASERRNKPQNANGLG